MVRVRSRVQSSLTAPFNTSNSGSYGEPTNGRYDNLSAFAGTNADNSGLPRTNPVHAAPICSPDVPQTNENPGALAGASGATVETGQSQARRYTDAPNAARLVAKNGNWKLGRWAWADAIDLDRTISLSAKALASKLVRNFAHSETAHCAPGSDTMAHALGTSTDSIKRLLRELTEAGWLVRTEGRGRGNRAQIVFLWGNNVVPMVRSDASGAPANDLQNEPKRPATGSEKRGADAPFYSREKAAQKGADMGGKGGTGALSYNKADLKSKKEKSAQRKTPVSQQGSRRMDFTAYDRATTAANAAFDRQTVPIDKGSHNEEGWNRWLSEHGFPSLTQLDQRAGAGWAVPFRVKPAEWDAIENRIAERWANWAVGRMQVRANA